MKSPGWPGFWDLYNRNEWDPEVLVACETSGVFVDIGAWCGPTAIHAAKFARRVVAVEPDPVAHAALLENTKGIAHIEHVPFALACVSDTVTLWQGGGQWGSSQSTLLERKLNESIRVPSLTPADLWAFYDIPDDCVVKMDIEGGEIALLEQWAGWLRQHCARLVLETHENESATLQALDGWTVTRLKSRQFECLP